MRIAVDAATFALAGARAVVTTVRPSSIRTGMARCLGAGWHRIGAPGGVGRATAAARLLRAFTCPRRAIRASAGRRTTAGRPTFLQRRRFGGLAPRSRQQRFQLFGRDALEHCEIGRCERRAPEFVQERRAVGPLLRLQVHALLVDLTAPAEFLQRGLAMLFGHLVAGHAIEIETVAGLDQGIQVGMATRMATQERRQLRLGEETRRARLDVRLDAQL
ncbi:MAG TPA: hypothetical protein VH328_14595, partial [Burkholderiaceae bacterium]|nr:hypothetical protein [Burkholderiaceae bacterium]